MPHFVIDCSESILRLADPDDLMRAVYAAESTDLFARSVVRTLKAMLPTVAILSMNVRDFEKATYCNASMAEPGEEAAT